MWVTPVVGDLRLLLLIALRINYQQFLVKCHKMNNHVQIQTAANFKLAFEKRTITLSDDEYSNGERMSEETGQWIE